MGGAIPKSELVCCSLGRHPGPRDNPDQLESRGLLHRGKHRRSNEAPCAQHAGTQRYFLLQRSGCLRHRGVNRLWQLPLHVVREHDTKKRLLCLAGDHVVRSRGFIDREPVRNQRLDSHLAIGNQLKKRLDVPLLGPAHVSIGIVVTLFLVLRIVPTRAVAAAEPKVELLLVVHLARNFEPHRADGHHRSPISGELARHGHRLVTLRVSGDQDGIKSPAGRERLPGINRGLVRHRDICTETLGKRDPLAVEVDAHHSAASRLEHLHSQLAKQSETDHGDVVARARSPPAVPPALRSRRASRRPPPQMTRHPESEPSGSEGRRPSPHGSHILHPHRPPGRLPVTRVLQHRRFRPLRRSCSQAATADRGAPGPTRRSG